MSASVFSPLYTAAVAITPSNTTLISFRGFLVTVAGTVVVLTPDSPTEVTLTVLAGVIYPIAIIRCAATSTATGIFGLV